MHCISLHCNVFCLQYMIALSVLNCYPGSSKRPYYTLLVLYDSYVRTGGSHSTWKTVTPFGSILSLESKLMHLPLSRQHRIFEVNYNFILSPVAYVQAKNFYSSLTHADETISF